MARGVVRMSGERKRRRNLGIQEMLGDMERKRRYKSSPWYSYLGLEDITYVGLLLGC